MTRGRHRGSGLKGLTACSEKKNTKENDWYLNYNTVQISGTIWWRTRYNLETPTESHFHSPEYFLCQLVFKHTARYKALQRSGVTILPCAENVILIMRPLVGLHDRYADLNSVQNFRDYVANIIYRKTLVEYCLQINKMLRYFVSGMKEGYQTQNPSFPKKG